jgi:hypothetical protein
MTWAQRKSPRPAVEKTPKHWKLPWPWTATPSYFVDELAGILPHAHFKALMVLWRELYDRRDAAPGEFPEERLADRASVSRDVASQVFNLCEAAGIIHRLPGRGWRRRTRWCINLRLDPREAVNTVQVGVSKLELQQEQRRLKKKKPPSGLASSPLAEQIPGAELPDRQSTSGLPISQLPTGSGLTISQPITEVLPYRSKDQSPGNINSPVEKEQSLPAPFEAGAVDEVREAQQEFFREMRRVAGVQS